MPQSLAALYVHLVFSTKSRNPYLKNDDIRNQMHAYLSKLFNDYESVALITGGAEDHVHILASISRNFAISRIVGEIKRVSSIWVKKKGKEFSDFQWQAGYGAFSVSVSNVDAVRRYISNQKEHHAKLTFQEEFVRMLKKHGITYDEKYLWD